MSAIQGKPILGEVDVSAIFLGMLDVQAAFIGDIQIWPANSIDPGPNTLFTEPDNPYVEETGIRYIDIDDFIHYDYESAIVLDSADEDTTWYLANEYFAVVKDDEQEDESGNTKYAGLIQFDPIYEFDYSKSLQTEYKDVDYYIMTDNNKYNNPELTYDYYLLDVDPH